MMQISRAPGAHEGCFFTLTLPFLISSRLKFTLAQVKMKTSRKSCVKLLTTFRILIQTCIAIRQHNASVADT